MPMTAPAPSILGGAGGILRLRAFGGAGSGDIHAVHRRFRGALLCAV